MFWLLDDGRPLEVEATVEGGRVLLDADTVERALGWTVTPDGLCGEGVCLPIPSASLLERDGRVDLAELAALVDRPLALDHEARAAYLGAAAERRGAALTSLEAPDFRLADLDGQAHTLSAQRGRKVLLVVWASW
jgi:hypothetical protein